MLLAGDGPCGGGKVVAIPFIVSGFGAIRHRIHRIGLHDPFALSAAGS